MIFNSVILNTIKIQKNIFNTSFNFLNSIAENIQTAIIVNTPEQLKHQMHSVLVMGETMKEQFNTSVNKSFNDVETFYNRQQK